MSRSASLDREAERFEEVAGHSASVAAWTAVSRVTGLLRVVTIAAVLGPTFFGNLFQGTNLLPNAAYELLAGPLIASLLVPALVRHIDLADRRATERVAGGFLGVMVTVFACAAVVVALAGPWVMRLFTLGIEAEVATDVHNRTGWLLLVLVIPQLVLYGVAGTGAAVQNAHGRFALAAGAPVVENVGVIATLVASALVFGTGMELSEVTTSQVMLLGCGASAAVALHAAVQWWGARRAGTTLLPRWGWRDPEVRGLISLAVPATGYALVMGVRYLGILVVASTIPGGLVAFTMAINFFNLPVALGAKPVVQALLPSISRLAIENRYRQFRDELSQGLGLAFFVVAPATVAYIVLCRPIADAVAFGEMATDEGVLLITASLAAVAAGMLGESAFLVAVGAGYARRDARSSLAGALLQAAVYLPGMIAAVLLAEGVWVLVVLGLSLAAAQLLSGRWLLRHVLRDLPAGTVRASRALLRSLVASGLMAVPAAAVAWGWRFPVDLAPEATLRVTLAAVVGAAAYLGLQLWWRAPELRSLTAGVARREVVS
jgi:putative peptidoglycan lipid II flippase